MTDPTVERGGTVPGAGPVPGAAPGAVPGAPAAGSVPPRRGRAALVTPAVVVMLAIAAAVVVALADPRVPDATDWHIVGVLAAVAAAGIAVEYRFDPPDDDSAPPWDVHTVWILPAALLTPPAAFAVLVALSVAVGMLKRAHPLPWRIVVGCTTVLTTAAVHLTARAIPGFALGALVGIVALWVVGAAIALVMAHVIGTPSGTALWLDDRWTLIELGCAVCGLLIAAAQLTDPNLGLAGVAPVLFAAFALRWPELTWHARIDPKTGLPNAWHWEERTSELLSAAELRGSPAAVMIIDLDRFKSVNDTYGHLAGDQVLAQLAGVLRGCVRTGDLVGRFGGEEFVVTVFGLTPAGAMSAAERIRVAVSSQQHELTGARGTGLCTVTCTIGVASSGTYGYDVMRLLDMADIALAAGKAAGRNRVRDARGLLGDAGGAASHPGTGLRPRAIWGLSVRRRKARRARRFGPGSIVR